MQPLKTRTEIKSPRRENSTLETYEQRFNVAYDFPVVFTKDLFHTRNEALLAAIERRREERRHRLKIFLDSGVLQTTADILERIEAYFNHHSDRLQLEGPVQIVPGGEHHKNGWDMARQIIDNIAASHLCRQSVVVAIGGGSVLDTVGFAASLVHRGLRLVRVPTTVLSQNDAGVGVKNGIDDQGVKNFAGTFAPPFAVLIDSGFLPTLPFKYWSGGIAEAFKVAIIKDREFFDFLCNHSHGLGNRDMAAMEILVRRCAVLHLEHIRTSGDPFEFGSARPLDFGHWSAHKLEVLSDYRIGHGQAVSLGMALDCVYAARVGLLSLAERDAVLGALAKCGLPIWSEWVEKRTPAGRLEILQGLDEFQEHLGGELNITLPNGIGRKVEVREMSSEIIQAAVAYLKQRGA